MLNIAPSVTLSLVKALRDLIQGNEEYCWLSFKYTENYFIVEAIPAFLDEDIDLFPDAPNCYTPRDASSCFYEVAAEAIWIILRTLKYACRTFDSGIGPLTRDQDTRKWETMLDRASRGEPAYSRQVRLNPKQSASLLAELEFAANAETKRQACSTRAVFEYFDHRQILLFAKNLARFMNNAIEGHFDQMVSIEQQVQGLSSWKDTVSSLSSQDHLFADNMALLYRHALSHRIKRPYRFEGLLVTIPRTSDYPLIADVVFRDIRLKHGNVGALAPGLRNIVPKSTLVTTQFCNTYGINSIPLHPKLANWFARKASRKLLAPGKVFVKAGHLVELGKL